MRSINALGLNLIKSFEGFRTAPYQDASGKWTIGYGHTRDVTANTLAITEADAKIWLHNDLLEAESAVSRLITVPLTDNQFAALVSLVFNCGPAPLTHTLGEKLNAQDYADAAAEFTRWTYADGVSSQGLMRRRAAEKTLFLSPS